MAGRALTHVEGLEELRRDLRALGREAGQEFDREARSIAYKVRDEARAETPKRTGRTARSIGVSSTFRGIAVRSSKVNMRGIEYGTQVWLRRGIPYAKPTGGGMGTARTAIGSVAMRQVAAPPGKNGQPRVVNEARYLIPRRKPIGNAARIYAPVLRDEAERMIARLQSRYRLTA
jgi:hypothetical protein